MVPHTTLNTMTQQTGSDPFVLALRQMSVAQLRRLAAQYKKSTTLCETRDDYVNRLSSAMSPPERLDAMRTFILAGQTSLTIYSLAGGTNEVEPFAFEADFNGTASREPSIVTVGDVGEIVEGQQHIQWAMVIGQENYLDVHLELQEEPKSIVVETFYEVATSYLQVRTNSQNAKKIATRWAKLVGIDFDTGVKKLSLTTVEDVHAFTKQLGGHIAKGSGDKLESGGFLEVTGKRHPNCPDLLDTPDYKEFLDSTDPKDIAIDFKHGEKEYTISFSLRYGSLLFRAMTPEATIQHVYRELKTYLAA